MKTMQQYTPAVRQEQEGRSVANLQYYLRAVKK